MGGEFLSFDEALAELQMATHELRSMVAQGEIRAFRDEDVLKFRRTDVLDLKKTRDTSAGGLTIEPTDIGDEEIVLGGDLGGAPPPGPAVKPKKDDTGETELLTGVGQDQSTTDFLGLDDTAVGGDAGGDTAQTVVPTIEIADDDMIDDTAQTVIPTVSTDEETALLRGAGLPPTAPSLLAEEDEATEMATQEISPDEVTATEPAPLAEEDVATEEQPLRFQDAELGTAAASDELGITTEDIATSGVSGGMTAPRRSQQYLAQTTGGPVSPVFLVLAIVTFVVFLFALPMFYGLINDAPPTFAPYDGLLEFLRQNVGG